ncbi:MAG: FecR domain-containing protein [Anaerolineae bacterium]|nr:FecR domain-containing protein [Anaerolineae bacterium]
MLTSTLSNFDGPRPQPIIARLFAAAAVLLLLVGGGLFIYLWRLAERPQTATITATTGLVQFQRHGETAWQTAIPGSQLSGGDGIRTDAAATAQITYFDGSITRLAENTTLTLTELSASRSGRHYQIRLTQHRGQTSQLVLPLPSADSRFEITTAAAHITALGTTYQVQVDEAGNTRINVTEGRVRVRHQQEERVLLAGETMQVMTGAEPAAATGQPTGSSGGSDSPITPTATITGTPPPTAQLTATPSVTASPSAAAPTLRSTSRPTLQPTASPSPTATLLPPPPTPRPPNNNDNDNDNDDNDNDNDNDDNDNDNDNDDDDNDNDNDDNDNDNDDD